jgi:hypothetical protein
VGRNAQLLVQGDGPPAWTTGTGNWAQLHSYTRDKIAWLSQGTYLAGCFEDFGDAIGYDCVLSIEVNLEFDEGFKIWANNPTSMVETRLVCQFMLCYFLVSSQSSPSTYLQLSCPCVESKVFPVSGAAFSHYLGQTHHIRTGAGEILNLENFEVGEEHCHVLMNQEEVSISKCRIDSRVLADTLRRNRTVRRLDLSTDVSSEDLVYVLQALEENTGIGKVGVTGPRSGIDENPLDGDGCRVFFTETPRDGL